MRLVVRLLLLLILLPTTACAQKNNIVNVYAWTGEIPDFIVRQFEKETHIKVNFSTYENNEIMYAKIRASKNSGYDVIMPSSYLVDRMARQGILEKLDKTKLPNLKNLKPEFLHPTYDANTEYSVPFIWGITGIVVNSTYFPPQSIKKWKDLWGKRFANKLLLLDDSRDIFSMALISLGYKANDSDPEHIRRAFEQLKELMKNVKVFSTDTVVSILIDEDVTVGTAWNGDTFKAHRENPNVEFIFPEEGFVIWVDNFSVPKYAPHKDNAYAFINYIMRPDVARDIAVYTSFATANLEAQKLLPENIKNNPMVYPSDDIVKRGQFLTDLSDETLALCEKYWEQLKMGN